MANSKYAYVRNFELPDPLLPGCFLVCRIDGHSFHRCVIRQNESRQLIRAIQLLRGARILETKR